MCVLFCFVAGKYCAPMSVYIITAAVVCTRGCDFEGCVGRSTCRPTQSLAPAT